MTPQFSVQYSTMQNILHSYDAEHTGLFFFLLSLLGETKDDWINRQQRKEKKENNVLTVFACLYRLKHSVMLPLAPSTQTSS